MPLMLHSETVWGDEPRCFERQCNIKTAHYKSPISVDCRTKRLFLKLKLYKFIIIIINNNNNFLEKNYRK